MTDRSYRTLAQRLLGVLSWRAALGKGSPEATSFKTTSPDAAPAAMGSPEAPSPDTALAKTTVPEAPSPTVPSPKMPSPGQPLLVVPSIEVPIALPGREPGWREAVRVGGHVQVAWTLVGGPRDGQSFDARATVRATIGDDAWLWFEQDLPSDLVPPSGQAVVLRVSREDGLRLVPGRVIEDSRGGSLLVAISGRVVRLQRRDYVRARVDLPPLSAIRLAPNGAMVGVMGVRLIDVSGGGIRLSSTEPLGRDDRLRLNLRLDDGPPIPSIVAVLESRADESIGPALARGAFGDIAEAERTRIIQYVYRLELEARRRAEIRG